MCGIAGILDFDGRPVHAHEVGAMCDSIVHRGPDDSGIFASGEIGFGMRRLSIIDVHGGHQPVANEDGSVRVVFNGEIYNFQSLRARLLSNGHRLTTRSDTEVLVHLYEEEGIDFVKRLRGMFAFALWDARRRQLVIGRDRLGIKPLYYGRFGGRLMFASEIKAILALPEVSRDLDPVSVDHLFAALTTPDARSIVSGISKLPPAHVLVASGGEVRTSRYWDVSFEPNRRASRADLVAELQHKLDESVATHMVSDVPVGAFLSGGLDSSTVVAHMVRHTSRRVKTFAIGFNEAAFNELPHARTVARALGTDHHELVLEPDVLDVVEDVVWHLDEPFGDPSSIPTFMVSRLAAQHVKVALSGDGGDEIFAGYEKYNVERRERRYSRLPAPLRSMVRRVATRLPDGARGRNFLLHHSLAGWDRYLDAGTLLSSDWRRQLLHRDVVAAAAAHDPADESRVWLESSRGHWLSAAQYLDLHVYLPLDILTKVDRMSMAHSLEARVPLLDHEVVEFAATIPPEWAFRGDSGKQVLKAAMRGMLPDAIIDRPKRGFAVPLASWFRGQLEPYVRDLLLSQRARERSIVNPAAVERLLALHRRGRALDFHLWTLIAFETWCRLFVDRTAQMPSAVGVPA
ncbi:MAG TPA: asparagine synthase (glutamine-hydrolyzing) [Thermoanaerobaculia bacterium]